METLQTSREGIDSLCLDLQTRLKEETQTRLVSDHSFTPSAACCVCDVMSMCVMAGRGEGVGVADQFEAGDGDGAAVAGEGCSREARLDGDASKTS